MSIEATQNYYCASTGGYRKIRGVGLGLIHLRRNSYALTECSVTNPL